MPGHMIASGMAVGLVLATIAVVGAASAAEPDRCAPEGATTVCRIEGQVLRVIQETQSPSGQYAIAWLVPAAEELLVTDQDGSVRADGVEVANVLVRLHDATILARQAGIHPGDLARYNHLQIDVHWSAGSTFVGVVNQDKWETLSATVFGIAADGDAVGPFNLLALGREAGLRHLAQHHPRIDASGFAARLMLDAVEDNGQINGRLTLEEPGGGGDAYTCSIILRVEDISGKLHAMAIRLGQLKRLE